jgi:hypothetical protein
MRDGARGQLSTAMTKLLRLNAFQAEVGLDRSSKHSILGNVSRTKALDFPKASKNNAVRRDQ